VIHFNHDPITKKKCNIEQLIEMKNNSTYKSIIDQSFIEADSVINDKETFH